MKTITVHFLLLVANVSVAVAMSQSGPAHHHPQQAPPAPVEAQPTTPDGPTIIDTAMTAVRRADGTVTVAYTR